MEKELVANLKDPETKDLKPSHLILTFQNSQFTPDKWRSTINSVKSKLGLSAIETFKSSKTWNAIHLLWMWSKGSGFPELCSLFIVAPNGIINNKLTSHIKVVQMCHDL